VHPLFNTPPADDSIDQKKMGQVRRACLEADGGTNDVKLCCVKDDETGARGHGDVEASLDLLAAAGSEEQDVVDEELVAACARGPR
jgi:hypothetical protein